jgi:hypothetical protein
MGRKSKSKSRKPTSKSRDFVVEFPDTVHHGDPQRALEDRQMIYCSFAQAFEIAQEIEADLVVLAVTGAENPGGSTVEELLGKTMGQLQSIVQQRHGKHLADDFKKALHIRNYLAHDYFEERGWALMSEEGRSRMCEELFQVLNFMYEVSETLSDLVSGIELTPDQKAALRWHGSPDDFGRPIPGLPQKLTTIWKEE